MSKEFEEAKLVITADIVFDPDDMIENYSFHREMVNDICRVLVEYDMLYKNLDVKLESFICESK